MRCPGGASGGARRLSIAIRVTDYGRYALHADAKNDRGHRTPDERHTVSKPAAALKATTKDAE